MLLAKIGQILGNFASKEEKTFWQAIMFLQTVEVNKKEKKKKRKAYGFKCGKYNTVVKF